ncbi:MAG TPA: LemA family protein [Abditibacteriaceae bacterium]|jgi:LemA protein
MQNPQQKPQNPTDFSDENYSPAELEQVYERAAQLQSGDAFRNPDDNLDRSALERSAGRAGIDTKYVRQAVEELRKEEKSLKAQQIEAEQQKVARQKLLKKAAVPVALVIGLFGIISYSSLNSKASEVDAKQANLETVLERRHNLIPNLIAASKAAAAHEKQTFSTLSQLQKQAQGAPSFEQKMQAENQLSGAMRQALESLRDEGSGPLFVRLSDEMAGAENRISVERKRYNEAVQNYNRTAGAFPVVVFRPILGFPAQKPYFQATGAAKEAPKF